MSKQVIITSLVTGLVTSLIAGLFLWDIQIRYQDKERNFDAQMAKRDAEDKIIREENRELNRKQENIIESYAYKDLADSANKRKATRDSVNFYRNYLRNLQPIKAYQSKAMKEYYFEGGGMSRPSDILDRTEVLSTIEAFCTQWSFFNLFSINEFFVLPQSVSSEIALFFDEATRDCGRMGINAEIELSDEWSRKLGLDLAGASLDYEVIRMNFDTIIGRATDVFKALNKEEEKLDAKERQ